MFSDNMEETQLIGKEKLWTRSDKIMLTFAVLLNFGDGIEMYLPGFHFKLKALISTNCNVSSSSFESSISFH